MAQVLSDTYLESAGSTIETKEELQNFLKKVLEELSEADLVDGAGLIEDPDDFVLGVNGWNGGDIFFLKVETA